MQKHQWKKNQNITIHYVYFADNDEDFDRSKAIGGEKDEIADVKWFEIGKVEGKDLKVDIYSMMSIDWAFSHERRIIEHLSQFYNLQYKDEKEEKAI